MFRKARPSFFRVLQRMTLVLNVTNLKYGQYDMTSKKKNNNNKRLIDKANFIDKIYRLIDKAIFLFTSHIVLPIF